MSVVDGIRAMLDMGISLEQALKAAEAFEATKKDPRSDRNRRYYEAHKASEKRLKPSESPTEHERLNSDAQTLLLEDNPILSKKEIEGVKTPRQELEIVLDAQHAGWVLDHRQHLRKPLSARAAHQLAAKLKLFTDPNVAADVMIEKGWSGIEVDWLSKGGTNGAAVPIKVNGHQLNANLDTLSEEDWLKRLSYCRERREWKAYLGPPPFAPGCKVPPHLLDERDKQMRLEHVS